MGLVDKGAVVACNGVTECDYAIKAATANPIQMVPVEKKSCLRMTASFAFVNAEIMDQPCFRMLPLP